MKLIMITPEPIKKLTDLLSKLPGVGPRQASRFAFYLVNSPKSELSQLVSVLADLQKVKLCPQCGFVSNDTLCAICSDKRRDQNTLAVVERATDLLSLERSGYYHGLYFILGGNIYSDKNLSLAPLKKRIQSIISQNRAEQVEIILATNPTTEGEATSLFIEKEISGLGAKISRLGRGLPSGADLEYADAPTLQSALDSRKKIK